MRLIDADALLTKLMNGAANISVLRTLDVAELINAQPTVNEWRDIDSAPTDTRPFLAWDGETWWNVCAQDDNGFYEFNTAKDLFQPPTHWMFLPEPPEQEVSDG